MSKKRDARIARAIGNQLKQQAKSARLVARVKAEFPPQRVPRLGADPGSVLQMIMEWSADDADRIGDWTWGPRDWTDADWDGIILPKLQAYETMRWYEIEAAVTENGHRMHHSMPIDAICDECQTRLLQLEKVDDDIYRFRLGSRRRLWGFRILQKFEVLWYDPHHSVYPTEPD